MEPIDRAPRPGYLTITIYPFDFFALFSSAYPYLKLYRYLILTAASHLLGRCSVHFEFENEVT